MSLSLCLSLYLSISLYLSPYISLYLSQNLSSTALQKPCFAVGEEEVQDLLLVVDSINGWCPSFDDQPLADLLSEAGAESL